MDEFSTWDVPAVALRGHTCTMSASLLGESRGDYLIFHQQSSRGAQRHRLLQYREFRCPVRDAWRQLDAEALPEEALFAAENVLLLLTHLRLVLGVISIRLSKGESPPSRSPLLDSRSEWSRWTL